MSEVLPLTGSWTTECAVCGKHYQNGCGSTECCGSVQYLIDPENSISGNRDRPAHELKTWPTYFAAIAEGRKTFEARFADRDYRVGDTLILREWVPNSNVYTGREVRRTITYILTGPGFGVEAGYCILALGPYADRRLVAAAPELLEPAKTTDGPAVGCCDLLSAAKELFKVDALLRVRISQSAGQIRKFSEWDKHTEAMRQMEQAIKSDNKHTEQ